MPELSPRTREKCLKTLYRMCGRHGFLPASLKIPVCYDRTGTPLYRGGFADVWKGEYCGQDVAVKVLRTYSNDVLQKTIHVSGWPYPFCVSVHRHDLAEFLQGGCDVETTAPPEHPATDRSDNVRESVRNDIGLDDEWKHQQLCESTPGCESVGVGRFLTQSLAASTSSSLMIW